jgi:UDP-N-acetylglucosamine:LPS N-acetylglucosamine transferase
MATGVPLMPGFARPISQREARHRLNLPAGAGVVLVLGGGLGLSVDTAVTELLRRPASMYVVAMPGRNQAARTALENQRQNHGSRLRVCDWADRMDIYLRAADIVVGKPGGITVAEALACGRPLLATRSLGGQEGFNVDFLERNGVGGLVADGGLLARVEGLLHDRGRLRQMQRRAWRLGRRDGAARVAAIGLELARADPSLAVHAR